MFKYGCDDFTVTRANEPIVKIRNHPSRNVILPGKIEDIGPDRR